MSKFRVHFEDGTNVETEAGDGTQAKLTAMKERQREHLDAVDSQGRQDLSHPSIRVVRVEDLGAG